MDRRLQVLEYEGQKVLAPTLGSDPVQWVGWAPSGEQLLAIFGRPTAACCDLFEAARYWLVSLTDKSFRELDVRWQRAHPGAA